jgi:hypothetical protein
VRGLQNLAVRFAAERTEPSVSHLLNGFDDLERHTLYRSDSVALDWQLGLGVQKSPKFCQ